MFNELNMIQKLMVMLVGLIGILWSYAVLSEVRKIINKPSVIRANAYFIAKQITFVLLLLSVFNFSAFFSENVTANLTKGVLVIWSVFIILCVYLIVETRRLSINLNDLITKTREFLKKNKNVIIFLVIAGLVRMFMFGDLTVERWDAGEYYYKLGTACENYNFTWNSIWDNFRLCNHSSIGFAMIYAIGEFIFPRAVTGFLMINLIMTLAAFYMIYEMLQKHWADFMPNEALIGTILISSAPMILGTFGHVNVDYTMMLLFVFMLYAQYKKQYVLVALWGVALTQTKETGVFVIAGYYLANFVV